MANYKEAIEYIHSFSRFGTKLGLDNISRLLNYLGNPQKGLKIIHVAGTNGKGSTCSMIDSILRDAGYRVGLFTSPYLETFNERIKIDGTNITDYEIYNSIEKIKYVVSLIKQHGYNLPTEFEVVTALGLLFFKEKEVDFVVLEVGMGGRLDATNVGKPLVSVITPISYDHQHYLGNTLREIAFEKCGIIKPNTPVVSAEQEAEALQVICDTCIRNNSPLTLVSNSGYCPNASTINYSVKRDDLNGVVFDLKTPNRSYENIEIRMLGSHQAGNAVVAAGAVETLNYLGIDIKEEAVYSGLRWARWPGRLEIMGENPYLLIDGAHNLAGIKTLKALIKKHFNSHRKILVFGVLKDKDYNKMVEELAPLFDVIIATSPESPRALLPEELKNTIITACKGVKNNFSNIPCIYIREKISDAVGFSVQIASQQDLVVYAGSLYLVGSVRSLLKKYDI
ncbi:MAG: bifunctional folylpolyglutamate synthase/dihydrofolate synthase [Thermoanaerobacterales bacterium]|nr:bifunctional folylpolyglutamate synthase/dihydrofolate synthase [Thermoanaerobacterales bacterium]